MGTGSMNIREKVARAICASVGDQYFVDAAWSEHTDMATAAISAVLEGIAEEGWRIVPVKPTEAMFKNAMGSFGGKGAKLMSRAIYEAMCDAAPKF